LIAISRLMRNLRSSSRRDIDSSKWKYIFISCFNNCCLIGRKGRAHILMQKGAKAKRETKPNENKERRLAKLF
jgi:hypothetical protein